MNSDSENKNLKFDYREKNPVGFFSRLLHSCYNPNMYVLPLEEKFTRTLIYLFKLLLIIIVIQGAATGYFTWNLSGTISRNLRRQLPELKLKNGKIETTASTPLAISLYKDFKMIIDPGGQKNRARLSSDVLVVAVDGALFVRQGTNSFRYLSTSFYSKDTQAPVITINSSTLDRWLPTIRFVFLILFLTLVAAELIFITGLRTVLISFGGMIARNRDSNTPGLDWNQVLLISCYAITPVTLAHTLLFVTGLSLPYREFFLLLGGTLWTFTIVNHLNEKSVARSKKEKPGEEKTEENKGNDDSKSYWDEKTGRK